MFGIKLEKNEYFLCGSEAQFNFNWVNIKNEELRFINRFFLNKCCKLHWSRQNKKFNKNVKIRAITETFYEEVISGVC